MDNSAFTALTGLPAKPRTRDVTIKDILRNAARLSPATVAVTSTHEEREFTYREVDQRSTRLANALRDQCGAEYRDTVSIVSPNSFRYVEVYFANAKLGTTTTSIAHMLTPDDMVAVINNTRSKIVLVHPSVAEKIASIKDRLTFVKHYISLDDTDDTFSYERMLSQASDKPLDVDVKEQDIFAMFLTSGTTGLPKAVMKTHGQVAATLMDLSFSGSIVIYNSFAWVGGTLTTLKAMGERSQVIIMEKYDKALYAETIIKYGSNNFFGLPAAVRDVLELPEEKIAKMRETVKSVFYGGAIIPTEMILRMMVLFPGAAFNQAYGQTESGFVAKLGHADHPQDPKNPTEVELKHMTSVGRPSWTSEVRIVNEDFEEVPVNEVGEILCRSPGTMLGYFQRPEATAETLRDGWLRTGDAGCVDEDGFLYIRGRVKDMIIHELGINVYPREIEDILTRLPQLADSAVVGIALPHTVGEKVVVCAVKKEGAEISEQQVLEHCGECLADYKRPQFAVFLPALPYNNNGKVLKRSLQEHEQVLAHVKAGARS
eukprot:TRINITY_DN2503_c2_g1_i7.p1 TRINITY_DN2503_c2_g1~~TRINITY_DN2503_c2_g1_i7.p1  ORF type:complete len:553 (-),score=160.43 TRINITY_DN2503_c2_g1_i7:31-1662(-)